MLGGLVRGNVWGMFGGETAGENVRIPVQDHKSLCAAVMICATLVNTQTHTHRFDRLYY